jgi:hydrogenase 3 maturation protease
MQKKAKTQVRNRKASPSEEVSSVKSEVGSEKTVNFTLPTSVSSLLRQRLEGAARIGILGVGSELRADDVAGVLVAQRLKELIGDQRRDPGPEMEIFLGGTAPENLTGEIKRFHPTHLVIIDAADLEAEPGMVVLMDPDSIGGTTFCTHSLPLKVMIDYLLESFECHVIILGIQPKSLAVEAPVSPEVRATVESLSQTLSECLAPA